VGIQGKDGVGPNPPKFESLSPVVDLIHGGKGGDSSDSAANGGDGGDVYVEGLGGTVPVVRDIILLDYSNGGKGFNGCKATPVTNGTSGGKGGQVTLQHNSGGVTIKIMSNLPSISGGDGGDGVPPGTGGSPGNANGVAGTHGADGKPCPIGSAGFQNSLWGNCDGGCGIGGSFNITVSGNTITADHFGSYGMQTFTITVPGGCDATSNNLIGGDSYIMHCDKTMNGSNTGGGNCLERCN
jgi:hypothetical protein